MKKLFVFCLAALLVAAFTVPALGSEWSFYGSVRMKLFSIDQEDGVGNSDRDTTFNGQTNSRFGAKAKGGNIKGYVELGSQPDGQTSNTDIYTRKLYGTWDFGGGTLKIGKDYANWYHSTGSSALQGSDDTSLAGAGSMYPGRRNYISVSFGGLDLTLAETGPPASRQPIPVKATLAAATAGTYTPADWSPDISIPMLGARYTFKMNILTAGVAGSYLSYDLT